VREAKRTHAIAPVKTARVAAGSMIVPDWRRPWLNVLTIARATKAATAAPIIVQTVPQAIADR
jgi:hypothetical protein